MKIMYQNHIFNTIWGDIIPVISMVVDGSLLLAFHVRQRRMIADGVNQWWTRGLLRQIGFWFDDTGFDGGANR